MPDVFAAGLLEEVRLGGIEVAIERQEQRRIGVHRQGRMRFQFAEARRELLLLQRRDVLVAKKQHLVLQPQGPDFGRQRRILADIRNADIADLGADGRRTQFD